MPPYHLHSLSSRLIDLTEDCGQAPPGRNTLSPSPSLRSCDWSDDELSLPVLPALTRDLGTASQVECPLCQKRFSCSEIEAHAAECGVEGASVSKDHDSHSHGRKGTKLPLVRRGGVSARCTHDIPCSCVSLSVTF